MQVFLKSREELDGFGALMHLLQLLLGQKLRNFMAHFVRLTKSSSRSCLLVIMFTCMTKLKDLPLLASVFLTISTVIGSNCSFVIHWGGNSKNISEFFLFYIRYLQGRVWFWRIIYLCVVLVNSRWQKDGHIWCWIYPKTWNWSVDISLYWNRWWYSYW